MQWCYCTKEAVVLILRFPHININHHHHHHHHHQSSLLCFSSLGLHLVITTASLHVQSQGHQFGSFRPVALPSRWWLPAGEAAAQRSPQVSGHRPASLPTSSPCPSPVRNMGLGTAMADFQNELIAPQIYRRCPSPPSCRWDRPRQPFQRLDLQFAGGSWEDRGKSWSLKGDSKPDAMYFTGFDASPFETHPWNKQNWCETFNCLHPSWLTGVRSVQRNPLKTNQQAQERNIIKMIIIHSTFTYRVDPSWCSNLGCPKPGMTQFGWFGGPLAMTDPCMLYIIYIIYTYP